MSTLKESCKQLWQYNIFNMIITVLFAVCASCEKINHDKITKPGYLQAIFQSFVLCFKGGKYFTLNW